jgi:membrane-associated phospholipid phosphatase
MGWACADAPTEPPVRVQRATPNVEHYWDAMATTRWNQRATDLLQNTLPVPPNGQAWASRTLTYLSLAQYRAVLLTTAPSNRARRASVSAAVGRASVDMLTHFYTETPNYTPPSSIPATLEQLLIDDRSTPGWPGEANQDVTAGDEFGRQVAQEVWNQAQSDGYNQQATLTAFAALQLTRPVGEGYWVPAASTIVRSLWGARPFFLESTDFLLSPAPPGLADLHAAANEVYAIMTVGSAAQLAAQLSIANDWNKVPPNGPFTAGEWNRTADDLIRSHHRTEAQAARILAYANAAAFDAQIDCFVTKYTWWVARPAQLNTSITPAFATPNHPSYPSGHSCISSAFGAMLSNAFPDKKTQEMLLARVEEAGMSRIYAGIHYFFDIAAGHGVGTRAAAKALTGSLE